MKTKFVNQPFSKRAMMVLAVLFTTLTASATQFITDVMVIGGSKDVVEELKTTYKAQGWTLVNNDLNAGCGSSSDFIYLLYKSEENTDGFNHGYITDFYISNTKEYNDEVTYQDRTYKLVPYKGSEHFVGIKGDLNSHAGGDYIHLYYTTEPMSDQAVSSITFNGTQSGAVGNEGDSEGFDLNNGCENATKKIYMHFSTNNAKTVNYISYTYDTTNGLERETKTCGRSKKAKSNDNIWDEGWYVVSDNVTFDKRITVSGTVNLILCDGCTLEAKKGIDLSYGNTLNIYAQSEGDDAGKLKVIATSEKDEAGIGGGDGIDCGMVTIYGGAVEAHGGEDGAGIGGGYSSSGGTVTIYSGAVEAHGGDYAAGIGGGYGGSGGTVTIYGGVVEAHGGYSAAGIGGGYEGSVVTVSIYGGAVEAHGGDFGAGIGGGENGSGVTVSIYGGMVEAHGGYLAAGIGAGRLSDSHGTLKIDKDIYAYGGDSRDDLTLLAEGPQENVEKRTRYMVVRKSTPVSYLYYSFNNNTNTLTSEEKTCFDYTEVTETTMKWSNGWYVVSDNVEISDRITVSGTVNLILRDGSTLEAKNGIDVAVGNTLNIFTQSHGESAGKVTANGGQYGAGIGGDSNGDGGEVSIYGGTVEAHGGYGGAGIGGGKSGDCGVVTVYSGLVEAHGGNFAAGIGGGKSGSGGDITIYGGTVVANGGKSEYDGGKTAVGIGDGVKEQSEPINGTLKIGDGLKVYDVDDPSTPIATGPQENVETRRNNMIVTKMSPVPYLKYSFDEDTKTLTSEKKKCYDYTEVTSGTTTLSDGWYVVNSSVTINERPVTVSGTVNLILRDGCTLTVQPGIQVNEGNTLNIFAQSEGVKAGQLKILDPRHGSAGIGGYRADGGEIVIHGGMVEADGGFDGAGIGGGYQGSGGTVTIYGGTVEARGGFDSAGIGGGWKGAGGTVTIYGGKVKAKGYDDAAGIGGGDYSAAGTVIIYGGTVEAQGGHYAAGIGGGVQKPGGLVTIYGGAVEAYGGERSAGIGGGWEGSGGTVNIYGGTVKAHGGEKADGIGAGEDAWSHGTLKIGEGLNVFDGNNPSTPIAAGPLENVESRTQYMGVGKMFPVPYLKYSFDEESKTLTSEKKYCDDYTEMTETTNKWSEGWYVVSGNVEISDRINFRGTMNLILCDGCTLTAKKGIDVWDSYSALNIFAQSEGEQTGKLKAIGKYDDSGIGDLSGANANAGPVTIYGGVVEAYGGENSAGIDASYTIHGGEVTIYSGTVKAYGGKFGAGIGANKTAACGTVTVYGGTVEAYGGESGAGIGGCEGGAGGTVTFYGGVVEAHGDDEAAGIGAGSKGENHGTLIIDEGVKVYDGTNLSAPIAIGPENKIESRTQYMIAGDHLRGDANYDWKVNAADIVEMVNAKNDNASDKFVLKNADIDGSGNITQSDIDAVVKIILKKI